jgi:hypothetical protein
MCTQVSGSEETTNSFGSRLGFTGTGNEKDVEKLQLVEDNSRYFSFLLVILSI